MKTKLLSLAVLSFLVMPINGNCTPSEEKMNTTIKFATYPVNAEIVTPEIPGAMYNMPPRYTRNIEAKKDNEVELDKISRAIADVRNSICNAVPNSTVEFWLSANADGEWHIINMEVEAGMRVSFKCPKKHS